MGKISVNVGPLQGNIGSAKNAVSGLQGAHMQSLHLGSTDLHPFVQISKLESTLNGIISRYGNLASRDTEQFSHVGTKIQAADNASAGKMAKI